MSWDDLHAAICTPTHNSALYFAVEKGWTPTTYAATTAIDLLHILAWQQTEDGHNDRNRPQPFPRPTDPEKTAPTTAPLMGKGNWVASVMTVEEFLRRRAEREQRWRQRHQKEG